MRRIEVKDLPKNLGENYLVLISNSDIELSSLDKVLNTENVITGLVDEYTYINNSKDLVSLLIKVDEDSQIHSESMDKKVNDNLYVCGVGKYYDIIKKYKSAESDEFDLSDRIYGYSDIKVLMKRDGDIVNILLLAPFTGSVGITNMLFNSFSNMFRIVYGSEPIRKDIDSVTASFTLKFEVPLDSLKIHGRKNFDILINQLLSVINLDKYTMLESISESKEIKELLD